MKTNEFKKENKADNIKVSGLKDTAAKLKQIAANYNIARIYYDVKEKNVFALEFLDLYSGQCYNKNAVEVLTYDGRCKYGRQDPRPTMAKIKSAVLNHPAVIEAYAL